MCFLPKDNQVSPAMEQKLILEEQRAQDQTQTTKTKVERENAITVLKQERAMKEIPVPENNPNEFISKEE
jgi:hypothetical protein